VSDHHADNTRNQAGVVLGDTGTHVLLRVLAGMRVRTVHRHHGAVPATVPYRTDLHLLLHGQRGSGIPFVVLRRVVELQLDSDDRRSRSVPVHHADDTDLRVLVLGRGGARVHSLLLPENGL
jgi:hypothetical protein